MKLKAYPGDITDEPCVLRLCRPVLSLKMGTRFQNGCPGPTELSLCGLVLSTQVCSFHPIPSSFQPKFGPRTRKMIQPHGSLQTLQILFKILADFLSGPAASEEVGRPLKRSTGHLRGRQAT